MKWNIIQVRMNTINIFQIYNNNKIKQYNIYFINYIRRIVFLCTLDLNHNLIIKRIRAYLLINNALYVHRFKRSNTNGQAIIYLHVVKISIYTNFITFYYTTVLCNIPT